MSYMEQQMQDQIEGGLKSQERMWNDVLFHVACLSSGVGVSRNQLRKYNIGKGLAFQHKERAMEIIELINNFNGPACEHKDKSGMDWPDGGYVEICKDCGKSRHIWEQGQSDWIVVGDIEASKKELEIAMDISEIKLDGI